MSQSEKKISLGKTATLLKIFSTKKQNKEQII